MALRPIAALSLLTFALLAGCSDGPPSGDLEAIPGAVTVEGTTDNQYVAAVRPASSQSGGAVDQCVPGTVPNGTPLDMGKCQEASSRYTMHFMCLPEPSGEGYMMFQAGGDIGEKALAPLSQEADCEGGSMWGLTYPVDGEDQSTRFERFELRMGTFVVASASSGSGSQAFQANPSLSAVTVEGSYKGKELTLNVGGLQEGVEYFGRFYMRGSSGNLTVAETFPVIAGEQTLVTELANVGSYEEFHIHVGTSRIYVYQGTL